MDTSKPGPLLLLGGGALMVIASFLKWGGDQTGIDTDALGLLGILALLFGLAIGALGAIRAFGVSISLPQKVLGLSLDQVAIVLAATIFLWTFGNISRSGTKFGLHLTWIGAAIAVAGGVLASRESTPSPTI